MHGGTEVCVENFGQKTLSESQEDQGVSGTGILKWLLKKLG